MFNYRRLFDRASPTSKSAAVSDMDSPKSDNSEKSERASAYGLLPPSESRSRRGGTSVAVKLVLLTLAVALTWLFQSLIVNHTVLGREAALRISDFFQNVNEDGPISVAAPPVVDEPVRAKVLDRSQWTAECSSQRDDAHACSYAIGRGGNGKEWQSGDAPEGEGHWIIIDLNQTYNVHSLAVSPSPKWKRQGGSVRKHNIELASEITGPWEPVAFGAWRESIGAKYATFEPRPAQYVLLWVIDSSQDKSFVAIGDIDVYAVDSVSEPVANGGRWNVTVDFPIVPVTAFQNPKTHDIVTLASYKPNSYKAYEAFETYTSTWHFGTDILMVDEELIDVTEHDMFCPGTSMDEQGMVMVTGGSTPRAFSIYDSVTGAWTTPTDADGPLKLILGRGYHGQTYLSDGRTFMIGGEWSDGHANKDAEIYDPRTQTMTLMHGIKAEMIKMDPSQSCDPPVMRRPCYMDEWRQHHPWLYVWKNGSIFHAGPSRKMNWFFTTAPIGETKDAGFRRDDETGFADDDAVSGSAAMYDAENGIILTAGGAPNYDFWHDNQQRNPTDGHRKEATRNAFEIRLGNFAVGEIVKPKRIASMIRRRIFANAVIFPNGEVMIVGGQDQGQPFFDETFHQYPEIYTPETGTWRLASPNHIPRVYHSWAVLLPDATVLSGGGGLERPATDHYDAQIYQPPYLFNPDGTYATRPSIETISGEVFRVGGNVTFTTDVAVNDASLIRYSAITHALNNDLRRIKLAVVPVGDPSEKKYSVKIPDDVNIALPGYWMLFVLRAGVPSVSKTVQILAS